MIRRQVNYGESVQVFHSDYRTKDMPIFRAKAGNMQLVLRSETVIMFRYFKLVLPRDQQNNVINVNWIIFKFILSLIAQMNRCCKIKSAISSRHHEFTLPHWHVITAKIVWLMQNFNRYFNHRLAYSVDIIWWSLLTTLYIHSRTNSYTHTIYNYINIQLNMWAILQQPVWLHMITTGLSRVRSIAVATMTQGKFVGITSVRQNTE